MCEQEDARATRGASACPQRRTDLLDVVLVGIASRAPVALLCAGSVMACASSLASRQVSSNVAASSELRLVTYPRPPHHVIRAAPDEPDGTKLLYADGWRMLHRGTRVELAQQVTIDSLERSCHAGSGWMHVSVRGQVYWSSTFLGDLKLLGQADSRSLLQCGPMLVTAGWPPQLWTQAGPQPLQHTAPIGWASFTTPLLGQAWAFPDFWLRTSDGGKTFARAGAASAAGEVEPVPTDLPEVGYVELGIALRAWVERAVASGAGRVMDGLELSDGTWVRVVGSEREMYAGLRGPDGRVTTLTVRGGCQFLAWGAQLLARCEVQGSSGALVDTVTVQTVYPKRAELPTPPHTLRQLIADAEGQFLFAQSRLGEGTTERGLLRFDGRAWRQFPKVGSEPLLARHGWLVLKDPLRVVPAEQPEQAGHVLPANVRPEEVDLLPHSVVFVQRNPAGTEAGELLELDLHSGRITSRTPFPGEPGSLAFADTGLAVAMSHHGNTALRMTEGRKFVPLAVPADPVFGHTEAVECTANGCRVGGVLAWSRVPAEQEPVLISNQRPPDTAPSETEPGEDLSDVGFSLQDYDCNTVTPSARADEELRGLVTQSSSTDAENEAQMAVMAMPVYGGQLDVGVASQRRSFGWHGVDGKGTFRVRVPESEAIARLASGLPKLTDDDLALMPVLVARHFALFDASAETDAPSRLLAVRESGQIDELLPTGRFELDAVPLADGRALVSANFETYRDVMLLERDGTVGQRRRFLVGVRYDNYLALRGNVPGMVFADDAPAFYSLVPESAGTPVTLPKWRKTEPCRGSSPRDALTLILTGMPRLSVAGFTGPSRAWGARSGDLQNGELALVETTPNEACLRSVLLDAPISTTLISGAPWLHGRMQGQRQSYPLICRNTVLGIPRESPALELRLLEEEEAKHPQRSGQADE